MKGNRSRDFQIHAWQYLGDDHVIHYMPLSKHLVRFGRNVDSAFNKAKFLARFHQTGKSTRLAKVGENHVSFEIFGFIYKPKVLGRSNIYSTIIAHDRKNANHASEVRFRRDRSAKGIESD